MKPFPVLLGPEATRPSGTTQHRLPVFSTHTPRVVQPLVDLHVLNRSVSQKKHEDEPSKDAGRKLRSADRQSMWNGKLEDTRVLRHTGDKR